ncbi:MAG TPA: aspartate aminotransferase family protein, partial [Schlesneria sp.]
TFSILDHELKDAKYREKLLAHNEYNRRIFHLVQAEAVKGNGVVISLTDCYRETDYGEPMVALKSYILSPFAEEKYVDAVLESLWKARAIIANECEN